MSFHSTVLLNYFIHGIVNASYILHRGTIPVAPSKKCVQTISINLIRESLLSFKLPTSTPEERLSLPN